VDNTVVHWINQCRDVGGEVWISEEKDLAPYIENVIREHGTDAVLLSPELRKEFPLLIADLQDRHIEFIDPVIPENKDATVQKTLLRTYDEIPLGITSVTARDHQRERWLS
jgi:hypothetical protein